MHTSHNSKFERLALDPVYAHAVDTVEYIMSEARYTGKFDVAFRSNYARYRSRTHRLRFLDALRKELTVFIDEHRLTCRYANDQKCIHERAYAIAVELVRDELAMEDPSIAARHESQSFSRVEVDRINELLNAMTEKLTGVEGQLQVLTTSSQFTYDDIVELLEDMRDKMPYGKKDWFDLLKARLSNVGLDEALNQSLVTPLLKHVKDVMA